MIHSDSPMMIGGQGGTQSETTGRGMGGRAAARSTVRASILSPYRLFVPTGLLSLRERPATRRRFYEDPNDNGHGRLP